MISKIRGFFKIVEAVFIGNLLCCIPATLIVFGVDDIDRVPLVLFYSYIMFGITGTILWFLLSNVFSFIRNVKYKHAAANILAALICCPVLYSVSGNANAIEESTIQFLPYIFPTALVSLMYYWYRFLKDTRMAGP